LSFIYCMFTHLIFDWAIYSFRFLNQFLFWILVTCISVTCWGGTWEVPEPLQWVHQEGYFSWWNGSNLQEGSCCHSRWSFHGQII
jgi:hypothetical protein